MKEKCSFMGNYKQLRKHVKAEHPSARPREVDPKLVERWRRLEREREREDVISTIQSSIPGATVIGDYVIEPSFPVFFGGSNVDLGWQSIDEDDSDLESYFDSSDEEDDINGSFFSRFRDNSSSSGNRATNRGR